MFTRRRLLSIGLPALMGLLLAWPAFAQLPPPPPPDASVLERMRHRLRTKAGRAIYRLRQQTVEPVFGIIKEAMGFRRFLLRGEENAALEWTLVSLAYNLRRLHHVRVPTAA